MNKPCIFITGAGAGIGRATAILFARQGWFVGLYDIDTIAVDQLAQELGAENCLTGELDVTKQEHWQQALESFFQQTGRLDLLFNNAGILFSGPFETINLGAQLKMVEVNVSGVLMGCHCAFPYLQQTPNAMVINMSSASAIYGQPSLAVYSATKFFVRALTEALELEWKNKGIRVQDLMPLFVATNMVQGMEAKTFDLLGAKLTPEDIAQTAWEAANAGKKTKVHWPVGLPTKVFYQLSDLGPSQLTRWFNKLIGTH